MGCHPCAGGRSSGGDASAIRESKRGRIRTLAGWPVRDRRGFCRRESRDAIPSLARKIHGDQPPGPRMKWLPNSRYWRGVLLASALGVVLVLGFLVYLSVTGSRELARQPHL